MVKDVFVRPCKFCGKLFATKDPKKRKFCSVKHQRNFNMIGWIRRGVERGKLSPDDWRVKLAEGMERVIYKHRAQTAKELGISVDELVKMIEAFEEAQSNADAQHSNKERRGDNYGRQTR
jgi:hypothetical protein